MTEMLSQNQLDAIVKQLRSGNKIEALASKLKLTSSDGSSGLNQSKGCLGTAAALAIMGLAILYKMIGA